MNIGEKRGGWKKDVRGKNNIRDKCADFQT